MLPGPLVSPAFRVCKGCRFWTAITLPAMADYFTGNNTTSNPSPAPTYGLIPQGYAQAAPPYPTPLPKNGMYGKVGNVTNCPPYPQEPPPMPCMQSPPYPTPSQVPCAPPAYSQYSSVGVAMPNPIAPSPIMPAYVNQQTLTSCMVAQQHPLVLQMPNQQISTTTMAMIQSNRGVPASIMHSGYQPPVVYQKSSNSLTKEIATAVLNKVVQHAIKPKPKVKGQQITVITVPGSMVLHR
ncbi:altered inheritance of mitochondria protein 3-like [Amblyraja radiata]|uniref:altered inheritance of mitochondria protein 3-like n=1 Tax=Amblyraja radiata TaxID=386614 RepID=UPI001403D4C2|nr:altered inheritance of mitochondria protein 3-like [Amblyraja radiata]